MIAQAALCQYAETFGFSGVTFIPAGSPPHRVHESDLLDARHRLKMVRLATASNPGFRVSDIEVLKNSASYTIETLRALISEGKAQVPVPLIIGSDALAALASWREPEALIETACFLQTPRPDSDFVHVISINGREIRLNTRPIDMPLLGISSTRIRQILKKVNPALQDGLRYVLPEPVRQYVRDNGLYRE